jgi:hypothetical protein
MMVIVNATNRNLPEALLTEVRANWPIRRLKCGRISSQGREKQDACQGPLEITFAQAIET